MTATVVDRPGATDPPAPPGPTGGPRTAGPPPAPGRERPPATLALAEVALTAVSVAVVAGYARLFADGAYFWPVAGAAVGGHLVAATLRRLHLGPLLATAAHLALLPLVLAWTRYRSTTSRLLPTEATLDRLVDDLSAAWEIFLDISAPVPPAAGFVVVAMATAWVVALASDGLAFRLEATVEALAPATGLFLFSSILADQRHRTLAAVLFVATSLAFVLAARVARADGSGRWLATDAGRGARSLLATGLVLAAVALVPAVLAGPRLPGGDGRALLDLDGDGGGDDRITLSPLVDIRSRLIDQDGVEAFRVEADVASYWRLTALDRFDGRIWSSSGSFEDVDGPLPDAPEPEPGAIRSTQRFRIGALAQIWLPAAFEPVAVDSPEADVDWDGDSSSLVVGTGRETSDGLTYEVVSVLPRIQPDDLSTGVAGLDLEFVERFTRLPAGTVPVVERHLAEAIGGRREPYQQALALQTWFRTNFRYDLEVQPGHGTSALADFLSQEGSRSGYCEQFAGAFAAMPRALGIPARVAVGFTPGEEDEAAPGTFVVRGRNAHAWPELYFAGVGWVPFEPTPGRGAPGAEAYTLLAPDQADGEEAVTPTTAPAPATTGTVPEVTDPVGDPLAEVVPGDGPTDPGPSATTIALGGLVAGVALWLVAVPGVGAARRRRRRREARGRPAAQVRGSWDDSVLALGLLDLRPSAAETPTEFTRRAGTDAGTDREAHVALAELTTAATYGRAVEPSAAAAARAHAEVVIERARRVAGPGRRLRAALSPRRQWR